MTKAGCTGFSDTTDNEHGCDYTSIAYGAWIRLGMECSGVLCPIEIDYTWKSSVTTSSYPCYNIVERAAGNFERTAAKPAWAQTIFRKDTTE